MSAFKGKASPNFDPPSLALPKQAQAWGGGSTFQGNSRQRNLIGKISSTIFWQNVGGHILHALIEVTVREKLFPAPKFSKLKLFASISNENTLPECCRNSRLKFYHKHLFINSHGFVISQNLARSHLIWLFREHKLACHIKL